MEHIRPDDLLQLAQRKHREDLAELRARRILRKLNARHWLARLGAGMIQLGERLQARHSNNEQSGSANLVLEKPNTTGDLGAVDQLKSW
jgi:hypothetical protein